MGRPAPYSRFRTRHTRSFQAEICRVANRGSGLVGLLIGVNRVLTGLVGVLTGLNRGMGNEKTRQQGDRVLGIKDKYV